MLSNYLLAEVSTPNLAIDADTVRIDLIRGIIAEPVRIYQKRVVAPPVLTAATVQIVINPWKLIQKKQPVKRVRIIGARLNGALKKGVKKKKSKTGKNEKTQFKLEIIDAYWCDVRINSLIGTVNISNADWQVDNFTAVLTGSDMTGHVWGNFGYSNTNKAAFGTVKTKLDPNMLVPWFKAWNMKFLPVLMQRFTINSIKPYCSGTFSKEITKGGPLAIDCYIEFEDGLYRGVYLTKAETELKIRVERNKKGIVTLDPLIAQRDDGSANLKLVIDTNERKVHFNGLLTDVDPEYICGYIGILTNGFFNTIKFDAPLNAKASGFFAYGDRSKTDFDINIKSKRMHVKKIYADDVQFVVKGRGVTTYIKNFEGNMCQGKITADGYVAASTQKTDESSKGEYNFEINLQDLKFIELVRMFSDKKQKYSGHLYGNTKVHGALEKNFLNTMKGTGQIGIKNGEVFSLPIFGGLSDFMGKMIPGLDFVMRQSDAKTDFVISDGKIHSDKMHIDGDVLSLTGTGDYYFDNKINYDIRVKLLKSHTLVAKLLNALTFPISKLFEFQVTGTLNNPEWRPVNFSTEILKRIGLKKDD